MSETLSTISLFGIPVTSDSRGKILEFITKGLQSQTKKMRIFTPNPEIVMYANAHPQFKEILMSADVALPDGIGLVMASKVLGNKGKRLQARIPGVNFMEDLCKNCAKEALSIGLLGGKAGVAEKTAECLWERHPDLRINFIGEEWDEDGFARAEELRMTNYELRKKQAENKTHHSSFIIHHSKDIGVLFVAFGSPKQEEWIYNNLEKIPVQAAMGVGGAFDYLSGKVGRAPSWVQKLGFEWLFRLIRQPWRAKRQLSLISFILLTIKERLNPSYK